MAMLNNQRVPCLIARLLFLANWYFQHLPAYGWKSVHVTTVGSGIQLFNTYLFWGPGMSTGAFLNEAVVKLLCLGSSWLISSCFTDMMKCFVNNVFRVLKHMKHVNWKVPSNLAINVTSGDGTPTQAITGYRNASMLAEQCHKPATWIDGLYMFVPPIYVKLLPSGYD